MPEIRDTARYASESRSASLKLPSVLALLWIFRRAKKGEDHDRPEIVSTNAQSRTVLERAKQLGRQGREDEQAVAELRALARHRRRTLRQAERASRFMGYHHELSHANLANRLLNAAIAGEAVPPARTAEDKERIETVKRVNRLARDEQWAQLTLLQPALTALEIDVRAGRFGDITNRPSEEDMRGIRQQGEGRRELMAQLRRLLGPRCGQANPLLETQRALDIANAHLLRPPG